ncbi:MAG: PDZ domain-containing protein [Clostridia bacterium]|nr:PDZ domain-containing protein [Clostridia bacterium]
MKKTKVILLLFIFLIIYIYVANITLIPDNIVLMQGEKLKLSTLWGVNIEETSNSNPNIGEYKTGRIMQASNSSNNTLSEVGRINLNINFLKNISLKNVTVNVVPKTTVIPLGNAIGLKLYTKGILVVGMSEIDGKKPYENSGIEEGDRIIAVNNITLSKADDLIEIVNESEGNEVQVKYVSSDNEEKIVEMTPVKTKEEEYKLGLWVRDAAAGVGTLTFYEPSTGSFASLGHGITDVDTGNLITIANGELVTSNIVSIKKGEKGNPGEIRGSIEGRK